MQPDAARWMRPDADRWIRPDVARFLAPGVRPQDVFPALDRKYNPNQPRVPKGNPDGGQWVECSNRSSSFQTAPLTDISAQSRPRGHHYNPRAVFKEWDLPPETRKVFVDATTGTLADAWVRFDLGGAAYRHYWSGLRGLHADYNNAVAELGSRFLADNRIKPEAMTPDQARALLREIDISEDSRIRNFNRAMRLLRFVARMRLGRE